MGLYGALVVRPATAGQAYDDPGTAFDDEAVLVLSEIDPALNNSADPATFDMRNYAPRYFLINGKAYPNTDPIPTAGGSRVLLRYVNAGNQYHSMAVLGAHQRVVALDGSPLDFARRYVAETFGPGQTADAIVTAPSSTQDRTLPLYDGSLLLHNSNTGGFGGMLTTLDVTGSGGGGDTAGPVTSAVAFAGGDLTATIDDSSRGGANVAEAEFYLDVVTGAGTPMDAVVAPFDAVTEDVTAAVAVPSGEHVLYVRGRDAAGNWGPLSSVLVNGGDAGGPATKFPLLTPRLTNTSRTTGVAVSATGDDTATGGSDIAAAEYFIDAVGADGSGSPMAVNVAAPVASLDATIPAATVNGLSEGAHVVYVHSQDAAGNWGDPVTVNLVVDMTGPTTSGVSVSPSPNNGTQPVNSSTPAVRVSATTLSDPISSSVNSPISRAEIFIGSVTGDGSGIAMMPSDGVFNDPSEGGYADIPLPTVRALTNGSYTIYVHARDAAGNWGPVVTTTLVVNKVQPAITALTVTPNGALRAAPVTLAARATDTTSNVTRGEWFTGADPGAGNGTPMTVRGSGPWRLSAQIDVSTWDDGVHTLNVRARNAAGEWGSTRSTVLDMRGPLHFSTVGNVNPPGVGGTADDADIYGWDSGAFTREWDATRAGLPRGARVDGFDRVDDSHFYLSFSNRVTKVPGLGRVQDEDVVLYDDGVWRLFFDGTAAGLKGSKRDVDAISVVGRKLFFSTSGDARPAGVRGAADDADIYRWNGRSIRRVWDASSHGLPGTADIDGLVRVDGKRFYLSFAAATTTLPGLGDVQDEDVVYHDGGAWSVYFDGTALGLGDTGKLDVDAFDVD